MRCSSAARNFFAAAILLMKQVNSNATKDSMVKSWFGLFFALALSAVTTYLWIAEQTPRYMLLSGAFLLFAYPWSQKSQPISKFFSKESVSRAPLAETLTTMGRGLVITYVLVPFIQKI